MNRDASGYRKAKIFRAATMREALAEVRRDLGSEAVILGTREVRRRRFLGRGVKEYVEVRASREEATGEGMSAGGGGGGAGVLPTGARGSRSSLHVNIGEQLSQLHAMVEKLSEEGRVEHLAPELPGEVASAYGMLLEAEVPEALARRVARLCSERMEPDEWGNPGSVTRCLREVVASNLSIAPPIGVVPGSRRVVALVGPTGVGKTTTLAKLAANLKLVKQASVGLVTVDTFRIAAVEQLRTYADIIDLPLIVVNEPSEMREAIESLGDVSIVLVDTAGRSPRDEVKIRELVAFLDAARPDEVHLVLSTTARERNLRLAIARFGTACCDRLILTKLDEAESLGTVLGVLAQGAPPVSYMTTGQGVPDDIEPANRDRLAGLLLGQERVEV